MSCVVIENFWTDHGHMYVVLLQGEPVWGRFTVWFVCVLSGVKEGCNKHKVVESLSAWKHCLVRYRLNWRLVIPLCAVASC